MLAGLYIRQLGQQVTEKQDELNSTFEAFGGESQGAWLTGAAMDTDEVRGMFPDDSQLVGLAISMGSLFARGWKNSIESAPPAVPRVQAPRVDTLAPWPGGWDGDPATPYPMARGGIVRRPTFALLGESGPEAVVPLEKAGAMGTFVYAPTFSTASESEARRFAAMVVPHIERERRRLAV
jgi:hypothetical protein